MIISRRASLILGTFGLVSMKPARSQSMDRSSPWVSKAQFLKDVEQEGMRSYEHIHEGKGSTGAKRLTSGKVGETSRLMIVAGGRDIDDDPEPAAALARRLDLLSGHDLRTRFRRYEEEGHMSVPARAVTDTLRFVFELR